jgi:hypothetical protein
MSTDLSKFLSVWKTWPEMNVRLQGSESDAAENPLKAA